MEDLTDWLINRETSIKTNESNKLENKLKARIKSVEECINDLIKPYYDVELGILNVSLMSKKEKEEFINKHNCLLVQKHCYEEILELLKEDINV